MVHEDDIDTNPEPARILIVEDDAILALDLASELSEAGYDIVGPARCRKSALDLIREHEIDAALLDIHLDKSTSYPVAQVLMQNCVPFAFLSGYDASSLRPDFEKHLLIDKPVDPRHLRSAVKSLLEDF